MARKQNTPKKYPNPGTGKGKNPRIKCPECEKKGIDTYMKKTQCRYSQNGTVITVMPLVFCIKCKYVAWDEKVLSQIPD